MVRIKNTKNSSQVARAFTLIELLIVISIIAILAGMIIPTFYYAKIRAREAKARTAVKNLEIALKSYLDTYKVWPGTFMDGPINVAIYTALRGDNPQGIAFFEFETNSQNIAYDAWSDPKDSANWTPYQVMFDKNYDNKIDAKPEIYRCVVVYSFGENRADNSGGGDDVASWR